MKTICFLSLLVATAFAFAPNAPSSRDSTSVNASRRDVLAGIAFAPVSFAALPAFAKDSKVAPGTMFSGVYTDPKHPKGYRVVRETPKGAAIVLQDGPKSDIIRLNAKTKYNKKKDETTLTIDFSVKGGPKNLPGVYKNGKISFPDGNAWPKSSGIDGVYSDPNHPKGYRVVRVQGDGKVCVELQDEADGPVIELVGKMKSSQGYLFIDFSPKGGPKNLAATFKKNKLVFPDGNSWTKL